MKQIIPINLTDGVSRTIYAHYMKAGCHDFDPTSSVPHTAILEIEIMEETRPIQVAQIYDKRGNPMNGRVYSPDGITGSGGNTDQFVKEASIRQDSIKFKLLPNGNIRGYDDSTTDKRGVSELQIVNPDNECPTITTAHEPKVLIHYRIRKLTERECFRLMEWTMPTSTR